MRDEPTLDCQDCGKVLRRLSPAEAQMVALDPYEYIVYCNTCSQYQQRQIEKEYRYEHGRG